MKNTITFGEFLQLAKSFSMATGRGSSFDTYRAGEYSRYLRAYNKGVSPREAVLEGAK